MTDSQQGPTTGFQSDETLRTTVAILRAQQEATPDGILVVDYSGNVLSYNRKFLEIWAIPEEIARNASTALFRQHAIAASKDPAQFLGNVEYIYQNPTAGRIDDELELKDGRIISRTSVPVIIDGNIGGRGWYFRDITYEKRNDALQRALFSISEVSRDANDLDELFASIHRIVGELMDARNFYIALADESRELLTFPYFIDEADLKPDFARLGKGLTAYVLRTGQALLVKPKDFEDLVERGEVENVGSPSLDWVGVPLKTGGTTFGVLCVQTYIESVRYGEKERDLLVFVSQHIASAIEHKRKEDALRHAKEYSENIIKAANVIIAHLDTSGNVELMNKRAEQITGYSLDELKGKNWFELLIPLGRYKALWEQLDLGPSKPLPTTLETPIMTRLRKERQISWRNSDLFDGDRKIGTLCLGIDITERKSAEEALSESENRYRQMFENNRAVQLLIDPRSGQIVDANLAACEFYGYNREELVARNISDIDILSSEKTRQEMSAAASQQKGIFQFRHRLASGEIRDVEVHSGPIEVRRKKLLYSIIHDITERKRVEHALQRSEEKFRNIFNYASIGIYQSTRDGQILTANLRLAQMLGYESVAELLQRNFRKDVYFVESQREELASTYESSDSVPELEVLWKKKDGTPIWVQLNFHSIRDAAGKHLYFEGFVLDISKRRLDEATLRIQSAAIKSSMDGIATMDAQGFFTFMNDAFVRLYGYDAATDLIGRPFRTVYDEEEFLRFSNQILPRLGNDGQWRGEAIGKRREGTLFPQEISLTALDNGGMVCVARDITERTYAEEQIKHLAYHDALTGLPNRLLFRDRLTIALTQAVREDKKAAVLFFDLDRFKVINDSLGHNVGDQLLQLLARRIQSCIRESDTVARLGGDEFILLLPLLISADDAAKIARKILESVRAPFIIDGRELYVTTSIGISICPEDGLDAETLTKNADTAMYQAKEQGRDNYQLFNAVINAKALERLALENGLRRAVTASEFVVHYQPIFELGSGRLHGVEALVRWMHPELGIVAPGAFIPIAETTGLMVPIGSWVLRTACAQVKEWQTSHRADLALAVNLSITQLKQVDLVEDVRRILRDTGFRPNCLELEITESTAMHNPEANIGTLYELKKLGVRISLDDFGTGHSSLSYLKKMPIDTLKIDQSFVRDISADADTAEIVTAIIAMGHSLKLNVTAEGVEHDHQHAFLNQNACDHVQGFLFSKPVPADELTSLLAEGNSGEQKSLFSEAK